MNSRTLSHLARALALVLLIAVVAGLAASNAAWAGPSEAQPGRPGRSTVPRRGTDLAIDKSVSPQGFRHLVFTIVVTNNGPIAARNVLVTDHIARRLEVDDVTTTKGACFGERLVYCYLGNMAVGEVVTITIRATIWLDLSRGVMRNTASVASATRDTKGSNNSDTVYFNGRGIPAWFDYFRPIGEDE